MVDAEPDIVAIKNRIIKILSTDDTIFDRSNPKGKLRSIEIGVPTNNQFTGLKYPCCYITNHEDFETDKPYGPQVGASYGTSEHRMRFKIIFFDQSSDPEKMEKSLDELYKKIKERLKSFFDLRDPDTNTGALCTESYPERGQAYNLGEHRGKAIDGRTIHFSVLVHTN